jgi:hypothetical protein
MLRNRIDYGNGMLLNRTNKKFQHLGFQGSISPAFEIDCFAHFFLAKLKPFVVNYNERLIFLNSLCQQIFISRIKFGEINT